MRYLYEAPGEKKRGKFELLPMSAPLRRGGERGGKKAAKGEGLPFFSYSRGGLILALEKKRKKKEGPTLSVIRHAPLAFEHEERGEFGHRAFSSEERKRRGKKGAAFPSTYVRPPVDKRTVVKDGYLLLSPDAGAGRKGSSSLTYIG